MRNASKSDANHVEIASAFRACGFKVRTIKWPADLAIAKSGKMALAEVKRDAKARLTADQEALIRDGYPLLIVWNVEQVEQIAQGW